MSGASGSSSSSRFTYHPSDMGGNSHPPGPSFGGGGGGGGAGGGGRVQDDEPSVGSSQSAIPVLTADSLNVVQDRIKRAKEATSWINSKRKIVDSPFKKPSELDQYGIYLQSKDDEKDMVWVCLAHKDCDDAKVREL